MNICGVSKIMNKSWTGLNIRRRIFDLIPNITIKDPAKMNHWGTIISRPDVNRGIMGATALLTQPYIDYHNHKVDHETAAVSTCRTIGKIVAGTAVGCLVRSGCYYLTKACTTVEENAPKWKQWLMPSPKIQKILAKRNNDWFKNYNNTLATLLGLGAMLITNVLLDVPLTNLITKQLISRRPQNNGTPNEERKCA